MKRDHVQRVSLDDRRRRILMMQLIKRADDRPADTIAWYDDLPDNDKKILIIGLQIGLVEMATSTATLAASVGPILGAIVRDIELKSRG